MRVVIIGLSLSSSWGNGHATTFRSLLKGLRQRGHTVTFYERDEPWYAANRDLPSDPSLVFYADADSLVAEGQQVLADADLIIIGSYVKETPRLIRECRGRSSAVLAYYDIDTPVTITALREDRCAYLGRDELPAFDLYLSFSGGTVLDALRELGARRPVPFYCSIDPDIHRRRDVTEDIDLGYLGTYSVDRQPGLARMLLDSAASWNAGRFVVAGPEYPDTDRWPQNVRHYRHLPPDQHADFYCRQRFTLNLTRADMRRMGHSPSVRLFEAAACGTPVISDDWTGIDTFFRRGMEILIADGSDEVLNFVKDMPDDERAEIGRAARQRVLASHTGVARAIELENRLERLN